jgi:putative ABC transport system permease protein
MHATDAVKIAWKGLRHAGTRTLLTMLGIIIGISSVILLMSIGQSAQDYILGEVQSIGSNLIFVMPSASSKGSFTAPSSVYGVIIKTMKEQDVVALRREPSIDRVGVASLGQARAVYEGNDISVTYIGINYDYTKTVNLATEKGVWFTQDDVNALAHATVLGKKIATDLFGSEDPIGKSIRIKNISFQVIGVLESKGSSLGADVDSYVFLPVSVVNKQIQGIDYYSRMVIMGKNEYGIEFIKQRISSVLRENHGITDPNKDDFVISTQEELLSTLGNITTILSLFLTAIAAISLLVGGIGIMNIMLVSVIERTKEIGLRKAVGASNADILAQFLWESVMLTFLGGIIGILFGASLSYIAYLAINKFTGIAWTFSLPLNAVILAVAVSTGIGLIAGIYPARQAAHKNPIDALHYE